MIKKWALEKFFSIQNATQQMKTIMRNRKIWMRIARNQKIRICCSQTTCNSLQNKKYNNHSNKNKQNWTHSIFKSDMNIRCRVFCLSMWMSKRNHSTYNNTLFLLHKNKTSDNRSVHESSECQKSHQQFRKNMQTDQMIHSAANFVTV